MNKIEQTELNKIGFEAFRIKQILQTTVPIPILIGCWVLEDTPVS